MELIIKGNNVEVTERLEDYVHKKIGKLDRYLPTITEAWVELSSEGARAAQDRQVCQVTVRSNGVILRAEERSDDIFNSIDTVLDKMYRQIARYKGKRQNRWRGAAMPSWSLRVVKLRSIFSYKLFSAQRTARCCPRGTCRSGIPYYRRRLPRVCGPRASPQGPELSTAQKGLRIHGT